MSSSHPHRTRYPYLFAESVVDNFLDKYSRVVIFVARKLEMPPKHLRYLLIKTFMLHPAKWNAVRDTLKTVEQQQLYGVLCTLDAENVANYLTCVKTMCEDSLIDEKKLNKFL